MNGLKYLVTGGCSFTDENVDQYNRPQVKNWPYWLHKALGTEHKLNVGLGSAGNDYIATSVVHTVDKLLKQGVNCNDILVGIVWSGDSRGCYYREEPSVTTSYNTNGWINNPVRIAGDSKWVITNQHWSDPSPKENWSDATEQALARANHPTVRAWYKQKSVPGHTESIQANELYNNMSALAIKSLQSILWCNNYLDLNDIDYFQTCAFRSGTVFSWAWECGAGGDPWWEEHCKVSKPGDSGLNLYWVGPHWDKDPREVPDINWMLNAVQKDNLLGCIDVVSTFMEPGCFEWIHPDDKHSENFVYNYVIPHLKNRKKIDDDRIY